MTLPEPVSLFGFAMKGSFGPEPTRPPGMVPPGRDPYTGGRSAPFR